MIKKIEVPNTFVDTAGALDKALGHPEKLMHFSETENVWAVKYDCLFKRIISFEYQGKTYLRIIFRHYSRRKIEKIIVYMFADEGERNINSTLDKEWAKENDYWHYAMSYREGVELAYRADIKNCQVDNQIDWIFDTVTNQKLRMYAFDLLEHGSNNYYFNHIFTTLSVEKIKEMETPKPKSTSNKSRDLPSTSMYEQAIYYNVKNFFPDAINRAQIVDDDGCFEEADVFIPSIKVAIEYDGKPWHAGKTRKDKDEQKNRFFNKLGIYVIRVRDMGLPELSPFSGTLFYHAKDSHTNQFVTQVINHLALFIVDSSELHEELKDFHLSYEEYLEQRPRIAAPLFCEKKENNFTNHPAFNYWDFEKNGELNPENIEPSSNVFAWFKCPEGKSICECIQLIPGAETKTADSKVVCEVIFSVCPLANSIDLYKHRANCGKGCNYLESNISEFLYNYIVTKSRNEGIGVFTKQYVQHNPRMSFVAAKCYLQADEEGKKRFCEVFAPYNPYQGSNTILLREFVIDSKEDESYLQQLNEIVRKRGSRYVLRDGVYTLEMLPIEELLKELSNRKQ